MNVGKTRIKIKDLIIQRHSKENTSAVVSQKTKKQLSTIVNTNRLLMGDQLFFVDTDF
jgi:hypothetical protein